MATVFTVQTCTWRTGLAQRASGLSRIRVCVFTAHCLARSRDIVRAYRCRAARQGLSRRPRRLQRVRVFILTAAAYSACSRRAEALREVTAVVESTASPRSGAALAGRVLKASPKKGLGQTSEQSLTRTGPRVRASRVRPPGRAARFS